MKRILFIMFLLGAIILASIVIMKQLSTTISIGEYEAKTHIDVTLDSLKISIASSPDDQIHVQMYGYKLNKDSVTITEETNKFSITQKESKRKWYENFRLRLTPTIILQLPDAQIKTLSLHTVDGESTIQDLTLDSVEVKTMAGFLKLTNLFSSHANLLTQDGTIEVNKSILNHLSLTTSAGDVTLRESTGSVSSIQTTDGRIKLIDVVEQPNLHVKSESGDISIQYMKAPSSLELTTDGVEIEIALPKYDKKTATVGSGTNSLFAETKYGTVVIK